MLNIVYWINVISDFARPATNEAQQTERIYLLRSSKDRQFFNIFFEPPGIHTVYEAIPNAVIPTDAVYEHLVPFLTELLVEPTSITGLPLTYGLTLDEFGRISTARDRDQKHATLNPRNGILTIWTDPVPYTRNTAPVPPNLRMNNGYYAVGSRYTAEDGRHFLMPDGRQGPTIKPANWRSGFYQELLLLPNGNLLLSHGDSLAIIRPSDVEIAANCF